MKQYFLKLDLNQPKNKAQKAVQEFAKQYADCLIDETKYQEFKAALDANIEEANKAFSNCGDIAPLFEKEDYYEKSEMEIWVQAGITFKIRSVKRFELSEPTGRDPVYDLMGDMKAH